MLSFYYSFFYLSITLFFLHLLIYFKLQLLYIKYACFVHVLRFVLFAFFSFFKKFCFWFWNNFRDTGTIEQHAPAMISLLESCLNHDLRPLPKDEDPPHAKIASDIVSCIFLVCFLFIRKLLFIIFVYGFYVYVFALFTRWCIKSTL